MITCEKERNKGENESERLKGRRIEREGLYVTCGQAISRCQRVTGDVITVIAVQICLLPLECHSRRTRPASLTWSGGNGDKISLQTLHGHELKKSSAEKHTMTSKCHSEPFLFHPSLLKSIALSTALSSFDNLHFFQNCPECLFLYIVHLLW